jgi:hypothetical protein
MGNIEKIKVKNGPVRVGNNEGQLQTTRTLAYFICLCPQPQPQPPSPTDIYSTRIGAFLYLENTTITIYILDRIMDASLLTTERKYEESCEAIKIRPVHERLRIVGASSNRNLEFCTLVVLGGKTILTEPIQEKLRCEINFLKIFDYQDECVQYISVIQDEKIILIIFGETNLNCVPFVHDLKQIAAIYLCFDVEESRKYWTETYRKVSGITAYVNRC